MGLFSKRCSVCHAVLPKERNRKKLCLSCEMLLISTTKQFEDAVRLSETAKNPLVGASRCIDGIALLARLDRFVTAGVTTYKNNRSKKQWVDFFAERYIKFRDIIAEKNNKRKYDKKIGMPDLTHWTKVYDLMCGHGEDYVKGSCKACWEFKELNLMGYCHECIRFATTATEEEFDEFKQLPDSEGLTGEDLIKALLDWKLEKSKS